MPDLDNFDDLIDNGNEPEEKVPVGSVSPKGDEVPPDVKPREDDVIDDSKTVPPQKEDTADGTEEPELSKYEQLEKEFTERGLDKQFKKGIAEMFDRVPEMNRHITRLEQEAAERRRQEATPVAEPMKPPSAEEFYEHPAEAVKRMIQAEMQGINTRLTKAEMETFVNSKPDFKDLEPMMTAELNANPGLQALGINALPILYKMAKAEQLSRLAEQPKKEPTPGPNKELAKSTTGKKTSTPPTDSLEYWANKSLKDIEREIGFSGR
jgi:hypothetical protein